jgi:hypothetical protein
MLRAAARWVLPLLPPLPLPRILPSWAACRRCCWLFCLLLLLMRASVSAAATAVWHVRAAVCSTERRQHPDQP